MGAVLKEASNLYHNRGTIRDALRTGNARVLMGLLPSAYRGFVLQVAKASPHTTMRTAGDAHLDFGYEPSRCADEFRRLYEAAKRDQWNATTDLDWSIDVDPHDESRAVVPERLHPLYGSPYWGRMSRREQREHLHAYMSWLLSQFLHGEQGALIAACQVTNCLEWVDGKFYGSTQVVDEGRHVEVFHRYLTEKLEKLYEINDNLYVILDALVADGRWDVKFLCMQIMIEGLALGAFGNMRRYTKEPLLAELLRGVIRDEARHVHFGVVALRDYYLNHISDSMRREREDLTYELAVLMRNRFLFLELYDEYYAPLMSRQEWERRAFESEAMQSYIEIMFRRIIPNLKAIGMLSDRMRPLYEEIGLLKYEHGKAADQLTAEDLLEDSA